MRRLAFVLVLAVSALLVLGSSASACVEGPFDQVVHDSGVIWWAKVVGVQRVHASGLTLVILNVQIDDVLKGNVQIDDVLKGPGSAGDLRSALFESCGEPIPLKRSTAEHYVGQTLLFMGRMSGGILGASSLVLTLEGLSAAEQYQRALTDLGLQRTPSPSPLAASEAGGFPLRVIVLAALVVLIVVGAFVVARRRRTTG